MLWTILSAQNQQTNQSKTLIHGKTPRILIDNCLSTPLYTGTLNISFVHLFSSIAQSETPCLTAFHREKRLLLLTQLNS